MELHLTLYDAVRVLGRGDGHATVVVLEADVAGTRDGCYGLTDGLSLGFGQWCVGRVEGGLRRGLAGLEAETDNGEDRKDSTSHGAGMWGASDDGAEARWDRRSSTRWVRVWSMGKQTFDGCRGGA